MSLPSITPEYIAQVFETLTAMDVELDENPLDFGPRRLNEKVAEVRRMLSDTEVMYLSITQAIQKFRSAHRAAEVQLSLDKKNLMANDPETRAGRNLVVQDAIASMKLQGQVVEVEGLKATLEDLDTLVTVIKSKRSDLKDIQGRIKDQIKLCQEEIGLGQRWGSKPPPGVAAPDLEAAPSPSRETLRDLRDIFAGTKPKEEVLEEVVGPPVEGGEADNDALDSFFSSRSGGNSADDFLEAIETEAPKKTAVDLDEILGGFDITL